MIRNQKSGDNSTNVQTENITINQGVTYSDARQIALDVFHSNFLQLSEEAANVARKRAEEITDKFLKELESQNSSGIINAKDPDFQNALFTVQKEFARSGDKELGDILVDILVDRTKHDSRTIIQIVLNESLQVVPKLTLNQIAVLSNIFTIRYTMNSRINDLQSFFEYLDQYIFPISNLLEKNQSCYQHLEYAGCGTVRLDTLDIIEVLKNNYNGLFSRGFYVENIKKFDINIEEYPTLFTQCQQGNNKLQINAMNENVLKNKLRELGLDEEKMKHCLNLNNAFLMSNEEIKQLIINNRNYMRIVFDVWAESQIKNFNLTSVGIAIGHANLKRRIGAFGDLSMWIS